MDACGVIFPKTIQEKIAEFVPENFVRGSDSVQDKNETEKESKDYSIALALAGGSFRAAATCIGILRGFHQQKVTDKEGNVVPAMHAIKYNSGISGGSIPTILYSYAQIPTDLLLETDRTYDPSEITKEDLNYMPETSMGYTLVKKTNVIPKILFATITNPIKLFFAIINFFKIHSWWSGFMYKKLCEPMKIPKNKFFTSSEEEMDRILRSNKRLKKEDFLLPRSDIKTMPMVLWTLHGARADFSTFMKKFKGLKTEAWRQYIKEVNLDYFSGRPDGKEDLDMTKILLSLRDDYNGNLPIPYIGTSDSVYSPYEGDVILRKRVFSFPPKEVKPHEYGTRSRFSVETMLALSTNFPGSSGSEDGAASVFLPLLLSNVRKLKLDGKRITTLLADGGTNDLMGIIPAVQKKVDKIISVYNFNQNEGYANFETTYADIYEVAPSTSRSDPDFEANFREWLKMINPRITCYFGYFGADLLKHSNLPNHIFNDPNLEKLKDLMISYNSLFEAGEPLIATMSDLVTIDNPFWGVDAGHKVDITLIWFNMPKNFSKQVPEELGLGLDQNGQFENKELKMDRIPELSPDPGDALAYSPAQVNMIAYLGSWMVHRAWNGLKGSDGSVFFEGFASILDRKSVVEC